MEDILPISTFEYLPLHRSTNIRLIILARGSGMEPIGCGLIDVEYASEPEYEALSYEWGVPPNHCQPIFVNERRYYIRKNLYDALLHLRWKDQERWLWIDALCINQEDVSERNHQVLLMGKIFSQAQGVLAWVGPARDDSDLVMWHLNRIGNATWSSAQKPIDEATEAFRENTALNEWCNRTYWQRMWIIQEIKLNLRVTLCCGTRSMPMNIFDEARKHIVSKTASITRRWPHVWEPMRESLSVRIARFGSHPRGLKHWLSLCEQSLCADPRDKVFALLELSSDCKGFVVPDYSLSISQIYEKVLQLYLRGTAKDSHDHDLLSISQRLQRMMRDPRGPLQLDKTETQSIWVKLHYLGPVSRIWNKQRLHKDDLPGTCLPPKNIFQETELTKNQAYTDSIFVTQTVKAYVHWNGFPETVPSGDGLHTIDSVPYDPFRYALDPKKPPNGVLDIPQLNETTRNCRSWSGIVAGSKKLSRDLVLAPSHAQEGDHVYSFPDRGNALLIREHNQQRLLVGRAPVQQRVGIYEESPHLPVEYEWSRMHT